MTLQEFIDKKPEFLKRAKGVSSKDEFVKLAEAEHIRFGTGCLDKVYAYICAGKNESGEMSDDSLEIVAGGVENMNVTTMDFGNGETNMITI